MERSLSEAPAKEAVEAPLQGQQALLHTEFGLDTQFVPVVQSCTVHLLIYCGKSLPEKVRALLILESVLREILYRTEADSAVLLTCRSHKNSLQTIFTGKSA